MSDRGKSYLSFGLAALAILCAPFSAAFSGSANTAAGPIAVGAEAN